MRLWIPKDLTCAPNHLVNVPVCVDDLALDEENANVGGFGAMDAVLRYDIERFIPAGVIVDPRLGSGFTAGWQLSQSALGELRLWVWSLKNSYFGQDGGPLCHLLLRANGDVIAKPPSPLFIWADSPAQGGAPTAVYDSDCNQYLLNPQPKNNFEETEESGLVTFVAQMAKRKRNRKW